MKRLLLLTAIVLAACGRSSNTIEGVVQDNSGHRVVAWIDPMYAQGPPHTTRSNAPGVAADCGMKLVPQYADANATAGSPGVSLSPERQQMIGVKLARAEFRDLSRTTRTTGTVTSDERRRAVIQSKLDGYVESLYVNVTGQTVRRGEALAAIYSPDLLATQNELLIAEKNKSAFGRELAEAARRRLRLWDMSGADIDAVVRSGRPTRDVVLRSPVDGVVITKNVVAGAKIAAGQPLYEVADLSRVWILGDVYESDLPYVRAGQTAQVTSAGRARMGRVSFVTPTLDPLSRTAKVRIELSNADGALRPDTFVDVLLQQPIGNVVAVPDQAVLETGTRSVVFVARGNGVFEPRDVTTGAHADGFREIRGGVTAGEIVVAEANFLVDSESRLKSAIGQMKP